MNRASNVTNISENLAKMANNINKSFICEIILLQVSGDDDDDDSGC